ncbi:hypothetical protein F3S47_17290 [Histidinibacterium aquaticum]|uniref:Uncharacterized protein n=1 Tax=Histidinibacterium aquaticum TaxID=2613962 RepID=A0A5J5GCH5_9RHOB|nr:hypothetical protein F3S47_17290 [Histidinibacterium aquaticum]
MAASSIKVGAHGRYQIKSGRLSGEYVARAFPKPPARAQGLIAEAYGATEQAAIEALHSALDDRESSRTADRRMDAHSGGVIPSAAEYAEAIRQIELSKPQCALLDALALAKEDGLTEVRMARAAGYKSRASVKRSFASVGIMIGEFLSIDQVAGMNPEDLDGISLVGYRGSADSENASAPWILHLELREALQTAWLSQLDR